MSNKKNKKTFKNNLKTILKDSLWQQKKIEKKPRIFFKHVKKSGRAYFCTMQFVYDAICVQFLEI